MIKVIIADDHRIFIDGIKSILNCVPDIHIAGEALNGKQLLKLLRKVKTDVVLLDLNMPEMDGLQAAEAIKEEFKEVKIIMLTQYDERRFMKKCREIGVEGYLLKGNDSRILVKAIKSVHNGGLYYDDVNGNSNGFPVPDLLNSVLISGKELEVLELIAEEKKEYEIATDLKISKATVKEYKRRMLVKTGTKSAVGLIKWAFRKRFIK